jgi:hypothetical protein
MSSTGGFRAANAGYVPGLQTGLRTDLRTGPQTGLQAGEQAIIEVADFVQGWLALSKKSNRF